MFAMLVDDVFEIKDRGVIVCGYMDSSRYNVKLYDCLYDFYGKEKTDSEVYTAFFLNGC